MAFKRLCYSFSMQGFPKFFSMYYNPRLARNWVTLIDYKKGIMGVAQSVECPDFHFMSGHDLRGMRSRPVQSLFKISSSTPSRVHSLSLRKINSHTNSRIVSESSKPQWMFSPHLPLLHSSLAKWQLYPFSCSQQKSWHQPWLFMCHLQ